MIYRVVFLPTYPISNQVINFELPYQRFQCNANLAAFFRGEGGEGRGGEGRGGEGRGGEGRGGEGERERKGKEEGGGRGEGGGGRCLPSILETNSIPCLSLLVERVL